MKQGKNTCRILKEIRRQIASANDIDYVVDECQYKGDCSGTCPRCEDEVRYLEQQLQHKQSIGKVVSVVGLSLSIAAIATQLSSCGSTTQPAQSNQNATSTEAAPELDAAPNVMPIDEPQTDTTKDATPTKAVIKQSFESEIWGIIIDDAEPPVIIERRPMWEMPPDKDSLSFPTRFVDGGQEAFAKFIAQHAKLPEGVDSTRQYTVYATITIGENGLIDSTSIKYLYILSDNKVIEGETYLLLKQEVVRLLELMPKWKPAQSDLIEPYADDVDLYILLNSDNVASSTYR